MKKILISIIVALLLIAFAGLYHFFYSPEPEPVLISYTNVTERDAEIARLSDIRKNGELSWQDSYALGVLYLHAARYEQAQIILDEARVLNPKYYKIQEALGMAFFRDNNFDIAIGIWQTALGLSNQAKHLEDMIERAKRTDSINKRVIVLEKIVEDGKANWMVNFELGTLYTGQKEFKKAEEALLEVIKEKKDSADAYDLLAEVYAYKQDFDKTVKYLKKALKITPKSEKLVERLKQMESIRDGIKDGTLHKRKLKEGK